MALGQETELNTDEELLVSVDGTAHVLDVFAVLPARLVVAETGGISSLLII